jgi:hypothetical protein
MAIRHLPAYDEFVEFITSAPTLDAIAHFHLSPQSEQRIAALLQANRDGTLTSAEAEELDEYQRLEHIMRKAKIRAFERLFSPLHHK